MAIEPIGNVDQVGSLPATEALTLEYLHQIHAGPQQIELAKAHLEELKTTEQRVADGDPIAIGEQFEEEKLHTPVAAQGVQPPLAGRSEPAHEPGKGNLIDVYD